MDTLVKMVELRVSETETEAKERVAMSPEVQAAIRLSDQFEDIKAQEYILPLDALAGFCMEAKQPKRVWR